MRPLFKSNGIYSLYVENYYDFLTCKLEAIEGLVWEGDKDTSRILFLHDVDVYAIKEHFTDMKAYRHNFVVVGGYPDILNTKCNSGALIVHFVRYMSYIVKHIHTNSSEYGDIFKKLHSLDYFEKTISRQIYENASLRNKVTAFLLIYIGVIADYMRDKYDVTVIVFEFIESAIIHTEPILYPRAVELADVLEEYKGKLIDALYSDEVIDSSLLDEFISKIMIALIDFHAFQTSNLSYYPDDSESLALSHLLDGFEKYVIFSSDKIPKIRDFFNCNVAVKMLCTEQDFLNVELLSGILSFIYSSSELYYYDRRYMYIKFDARGLFDVYYDWEDSGLRLTSTNNVLIDNLIPYIRYTFAILMMTYSSQKEYSEVIGKILSYRDIDVDRIKVEFGVKDYYITGEYEF